VRIDGYEFPGDLWYHAGEHLWLRPAEGSGDRDTVVTIGVDAVGVQALGEVVYVQLLDPGQAVARGQPIGSLEAEKMVRPVTAPVSGVLVESNATLLSTPRLLTSDPYGRGWLARIRASAWEAEAPDLLHAREAVLAWARAEVAALGDAG
jgi:glycine cleavage system H protein